MQTASSIRAEVAARVECDRKLAEQIAQFLADLNNDPMCRFYQEQADEILAMIDEARRSNA